MAVAAMAGALLAAGLAPAAASAGSGSGSGGGGGGSGKDECVGGNFSLVFPSTTLTGPADDDLKTTVPAATLGTSFLVKGRYVEFTVDAATLAVTNWTLTGAPNVADITGGRRTVVFASKTPTSKAPTLTSALDVVRIRPRRPSVISRTGTAASIKIQAQGLRPRRHLPDGSRTLRRRPDDLHAPARPRRVLLRQPQLPGPARHHRPLRHRHRWRQVTQMPVPARVNFANDISPNFVGHDSAQVATRLANGCTNAFGTHCGGVSVWSVASGGRMGQVMGEDAVEVSPEPPTACRTAKPRTALQASAVVLGFTFPVPADSRLTPPRALSQQKFRREPNGGSSECSAPRSSGTAPHGSACSRSDSASPAERRCAEGAGVLRSLSLEGCG